MVLNCSISEFIFCFLDGVGVFVNYLDRFDEIYYVIVMFCYDKKFEVLRFDFYFFFYFMCDVDCVFIIGEFDFFF